MVLIGTIQIVEGSKEVKKDEAKKMYCPFRFSKPAGKELGQINPEWSCKGSSCMAWQKIVGSKWAGEHGYCGLKTSSLLNPISPGILRNYLKISDFP